MSIYKKWSSYNHANVATYRDTYGVYELGDTNGDVHYIGEGLIHSRLMDHFPQGSDPIPGTAYFRVEPTGCKERAGQRERALLREFERRYGRLPKYNKKIG